MVADICWKVFKDSTKKKVQLTKKLQTKKRLLKLGMHTNEQKAFHIK